MSGTAPGARPAVLFLCVHNAGRSQMAAAWLRHLAGDRVDVYSGDIVGMVDVVVSMGCCDVCPVLPGKRYVDWELTDPAGQGAGLVRTVRDEIRGHVAQLIETLDLDRP